MKRPLFVLCLTIVLSVALYLRIYPPAAFSYKEAAGEEVFLNGLVYAKEFQKGQGAPVLVIYLKPEELRIQEQNIPFYNNFICVMSKESREPAIGSRVVVSGTLKEYEPATNPGQFDAKAYYATIGISARITECTVTAMDENSNLLKERLWQIRCVLGKILDDVLGENVASFLKGMLLGDKSTMETEQKTLYKEAGILHILAISGLHISLLGMGLYKCLRKVYVPVWLSALCCFFAMILYGIMVGMPVSALRAISMLGLRLLATCIGRTYDMQTALMVCCVGILLENPLYLYHAGFLLSFLAVLGVSVLKPALIGEKRTINKVTDNLMTSFSVAIATLPIQLFFYYEVSVYAVLWNLLVIPLAGICLTSGALSMVLHSVAPYSAKVPALCAKGVVWFYEKGSSVVQGLPGNLWCPGKPEDWQLGCYFLIMGIVLFVKKLEPKYKVGLLCGAVLLLGVNCRSGMEVTFLDVGQGDCICLELPDGTTWLYDGGSSDTGKVGEYRIEPFLKHEGITVVDVVFLSHGDSDHTSGVEEMLKRGNIEIKLLVLPCTERNVKGENAVNAVEEMVEKTNYGTGFAEILYLAQEKNIPILWLEAGMSWKAGEVTAQCLHPSDDFVTEDRNYASEVVYIRYGSFTLLLTGDVGGEGEEALLAELKEQDIMEVTLLKVAHHGSRYSGKEEILEQIKPQVAVISCGENNMYGHPHEETLQRLEAVGSTVFTTPECGAIIVNVEEDIVVRSWKKE